MAYTEKQKNTIEYLIERGKGIYRRLKTSKNEYDRERYQNELDYVKKELSDALNAEAKYRAHLRLADEHIKAAEAIKAEWNG